MSAEVLRVAARLMRDRTDDATPGPWKCYGDHLVWPSDSGPAANDPIAGLSPAHEETAAHIASWHPAVALAVANWLNACATVLEVSPSATKAHALAVARAYLGDPL